MRLSLLNPFFIFHIQHTVTCEEMMVVLSKLERTFVKLPGALSGLGTESGPHAFHALLTVRIQEHHDGIPLSVVQPIHCIRSDVQYCMLILNPHKNSVQTSPNSTELPLHISNMFYHSTPAGGSSALLVFRIASCTIAA